MSDWSNRAARRAAARQDSHAGRTRTRSIVGASVLAATGLFSTHLQVLRAPSAYAVACAAVTNTATLNTALDAVELGTCDTIEITADIVLATDGNAVVRTTATSAAAVVVNGNGHTIYGGPTGSPYHRPFDFALRAGDSLAISDLRIYYPYSNASGAAISVTGTNGQAVTLDGLEIADAVSNDEGGAIFVSNVDLTITDSIIRDNTADYGGGISADDSAVTITGSTIEDNEARGGGGLAVFNTLVAREVTITDSTFRMNRVPTGSGGGGAIDLYQTQLTVSGSELVDNDAYLGGAINSYLNAPMTITDSTLLRNNARDVGGAVRTDDALTVVNSYIGSNDATNDFGAVRADTLTMHFSTVVDNTTASGGAAVRAGVTTLVGSVIASSTTGVDAGASVGTKSGTFSVATDTSCGLTGSTNQQGIAFGALQLAGAQSLVVNGVDQTYRQPAGTSPLVVDAPTSDAGTGVGADQIGSPRPGTGNTFTIGSRQVDYTAPVPPTPPAPTPAPTPVPMPTPAPTSAPTAPPSTAPTPSMPPSTAGPDPSQDRPVAVPLRRARATVFFTALSSRLSDVAKARLDALLERAGTRGVHTVVVGFVQPVGPVANDASLSQRRARVVARYLREQGLRGAISVSGRGRARETGAEARRVEVTVTYRR